MSNSTLKVATYNVNGVRARLESLLGWLQSQSPDIICLQETKAQDEDFPAEPIRQAGWSVVFRGQKAHAGVAIISREAPTDVAYGLDDGGDPDELRVYQGTIPRGLERPEPRSLCSDHQSGRSLHANDLPEPATRSTPRSPHLESADLVTSRVTD